MIKIIGIAIVATLICVILRKYSPEYVIVAEICGLILVLYIVFPNIKETLDFFTDNTVQSGIDSEYVKIIIKTLGIAIVTQSVSDICKNSGQSALSSAVELAGKLIIAIISLPMAKALLEIAEGIIRMD